MSPTSFEEVGFQAGVRIVRPPGPVRSESDELLLKALSLRVELLGRLDVIRWKILAAFVRHHCNAAAAARELWPDKADNNQPFVSRELKKLTRIARTYLGKDLVLRRPAVTPIERLKRVLMACKADQTPDPKLLAPHLQILQRALLDLGTSMLDRQNLQAGGWRLIALSAKLISQPPISS